MSFQVASCLLSSSRISCRLVSSSPVSCGALCARCTVLSYLVSWHAVLCHAPVVSCRKFSYPYMALARSLAGEVPFLT